MPVAGRADDSYACLRQPVARGVNVVDSVRKVTEIASSSVELRVPLVSELNRWHISLLGMFGIFWSCEKRKRKSPLFTDVAADFDKPQLVAEEV